MLRPAGVQEPECQMKTGYKGQRDEPVKYHPAPTASGQTTRKTALSPEPRFTDKLFDKYPPPEDWSTEDLKLHPGPNLKHFSCTSYHRNAEDRLPLLQPSARGEKFIRMSSNLVRRNVVSVRCDARSFPPADYSVRGPFKIRRQHPIKVKNLNKPSLLKSLTMGEGHDQLFLRTPGEKSVKLDDDYEIITVTEPCQEEVAATLQSTGAGQRATVSTVIVLISGFEARAECYNDFSDHLASWGYTVVQPNLGSFTEDFVLQDTELAKDIPRVIAALKATGRQYLSTADWSKGIGLAGHSRGGKLAALIFAYAQQSAQPQLLQPEALGQLTEEDLAPIKDLNIRSAFFFDPVNNRSTEDKVHFTAENPSAVALWKALHDDGQPVSVGIIGAGEENVLPFLGNLFHPRGQTYQEFVNQDDAATSWNLLIPRAQHLDFCKTFDTIWAGGLSGYGVSLVGFGLKLILVLTLKLPLTARRVIGLSQGPLVAWFEKSFNANAYNQQWYPEWKARNIQQGLVEEARQK